MITISRTNILLSIGIAVLSLFLVLQTCTRKHDDQKANIELINALNDSIKTFKNKNDDNVARISVIETQRAKDFLILKLKDSVLQELQSTVQAYKKELKASGSVTQALVETIAKLKGKTDVTVVKGDTVYHDSVAYIYPTYTHQVDNGWIKYKGVMNKDSSTLDLKIKDEFSVIIGENRQGTFADLITKNPYSEVKSLRVYKVKLPKPKRFGVGPNISYGFGSDFKINTFIGIGVQYNLLRF